MVNPVLFVALAGFAVGFVLFMALTSDTERPRETPQGNNRALPPPPPPPSAENTRTNSAQQTRRRRNSRKKEDRTVQNTCSICMDELFSSETNEKLGCPIETPCEHYYHSRCLKKWVNQEQICPECRKALDNNFVVSLTLVAE